MKLLYNCNQTIKMSTDISDKLIQPTTLSTRFEIKNWTEEGETKYFVMGVNNHLSNVDIIIKYDNQTFIFTNEYNEKYNEIPDNCYIHYIKSPINYKNNKRSIDIYHNKKLITIDNRYTSYILMNYQREFEKYFAYDSKETKYNSFYSISCNLEDSRFLKKYKTYPHSEKYDKYYTILIQMVGFSDRNIEEMNEEYENNKNKLEFEHTDVVSMDSTDSKQVPNETKEIPKLYVPAENIPNFYVPREKNRVGYVFIDDSINDTYTLVTDLSSQDEEVMFEGTKQKFSTLLSGCTHYVGGDECLYPKPIRIYKKHKGFIEHLLRNDITRIPNKL